MSDALAAIAHRMETVRQLGAVATAMRGIAAARQREAEARLGAVRSYAATVGNAIGVALSLLPDREAPAAASDGDDVLILLTTEQGFAGAFCDHALDAAGRMLAGMRRPALMLAGDRGHMLARARGLTVDWTTAMPLHVREATGIADRIADALYQRLAASTVSRVTLLYAAPDDGAFPQFRARQLLPFDYGRFAVKPSAIAPLVTMPPDRLLPMLAEEYVFAELCEALVLAFAAENAARLRAMMAISENVREMGEALARSYSQRRQEAITEEVIELAANIV